MTPAVRPSFWKSPLGWAFLGLVAIAAWFIAAGHAAHVLSVLAWLGLLACPLMHVFMHGRHGRRGHDHAAPGPRRE